jgi:hypothetical protein
VREAGRRLAFAKPTLAVLLFLIYCWTSLQQKNARQNLDTFSAFVPAWSLGQRGTLDIPEFLGASPWFQEHGGQVLSDRMPGIILWASPFYALLGSEAGPSFRVAGIASAVAATLAVLVMYRVLRLLLSESRALLGSALFAFGTATWTVSANALWAHGIDQLVISVSLLAMANQRYVIAGLSLAYGILTRPHLAVVAFVFGVGEAARLRRLGPVLKIGLSSSLGVLALLAYNVVIFGQVTLLVGVYSGRTETASETVSAGPSDFGLSYLTAVAGTLTSPSRGLLVMSPALLLLLPGLKRAWFAGEPWVREAALGGALYMAVQLLGNGFSGGSYFFSYRLPLEWLTLSLPLLALAWREWTCERRWRRVTFAVLSLLSVFQHAVGALLVTDDLTFEPRPWSRSQVIEGIADASAAQLLSVTGLVIMGIVSLAALMALLQRGTTGSARPHENSVAGPA